MHHWGKFSFEWQNLTPGKLYLSNIFPKTPRLTCTDTQSLAISDDFGQNTINHYNSYNCTFQTRPCRGKFTEQKFFRGRVLSFRTKLQQYSIFENYLNLSRQHFMKIIEYDAIGSLRWGQISWFLGKFCSYGIKQQLYQVSLLCPKVPKSQKYGDYRPYYKLLVRKQVEYISAW